MDPINSFFQTMAATTKKLPEKVQVQIKRQIFNTVNDAEENEIRLVSASTQAPTPEDVRVSTNLRQYRSYRTNHSTASTSGSGYGTASGFGYEAVSGFNYETASTCL